jgi:hypothetical protein
MAQRGLVELEQRSQTAAVDPGIGHRAAAQQPAQRLRAGVLVQVVQQALFAGIESEPLPEHGDGRRGRRLAVVADQPLEGGAGALAQQRGEAVADRLEIEIVDQPELQRLALAADQARDLAQRRKAQRQRVPIEQRQQQRQQLLGRPAVEPARAGAEVGRDQRGHGAQEPQGVAGGAALGGGDGAEVCEPGTAG